MKTRSLITLLALLVSLAAFGEEESARPMAPELHPAPSALIQSTKPSPKPSKASAKKKSKKPTSTQEGLELAPAPLMIQKP